MFLNSADCHHRSLARSLLVVAALLPACNGGAQKTVETKPPDTSVDTDAPDTGESRGNTEEWNERWLGSFVGYLNVTGEDALADCEGLSNESDGDWEGRPLFALALDASEFVLLDLTSSAGLAEREALAASELSRFCWISAASPDAQELGAVAFNSLMSWAEEAGIALSADLPNTVPLSLPVAAQTSATLVGADAPLLDGDSARVRVSIADTEPGGRFDPNTPGDTAHGRGTAQIVYSLLCDPNKGAPTLPGTTTTCGADIGYVHALPYAIDTATTSSLLQSAGGFYGSYTSLSVAIRAAVRAYVADPLPTVLNLSLGWNGGSAYPVDVSLRADLADDDSGSRATRRRFIAERPSGYTAGSNRTFVDLTAGEKAVYEALVLARCTGILPMASAGNRTYLPTPSTDLQEGAMLPGGWIDVGSTDALAECAGRGHPDTRWDADEPLVWAVSGVDRQGQAAGIGRPGSVAPITALAMGMVVPDGALLTGSQYHRMSGTSAAAAVATAAAAGAWFRDVSLDGDDVMAAIYRSANPMLLTDGTTSTTVDIGTNTQAILDPTASTFGARVVQLCAAAEEVSAVSACPGTSHVLGATAPLATGSTTVALSPTPIDCTAATASGSAPCGDRFEPTFDVQDKVWPQPVGCSCPPCDLEIHSDGVAGFDGTLNFGSSSAIPFWQSADFTSKNDITSFTLVLRESPVNTTRIRFDALSSGYAALTGTPAATQVQLGTVKIDVNSAMLVIQGEHRLTRARWSRQVPFPVSHATLP